MIIIYLKQSQNRLLVEKKSRLLNSQTRNELVREKQKYWKYQAGNGVRERSGATELTSLLPVREVDRENYLLINFAAKIFPIYLSQKLEDLLRNFKITRSNFDVVFLDLFTRCLKT